MFTSYIISAHPLLQPYVDSYMLCSSGKETTRFEGAWIASSEMAIVFHLADAPVHFLDNGLPSVLQHKNGCITGLMPKPNNNVFFKGRYHSFIIQFKATGFNRLFGIPATELVNNIFTVEDILDKSGMVVSELLHAADSVEQMSAIADSYLLRYLKKKNARVDPYNAITLISNEMGAGASLLTIEAYARKANMSLRNFERRFNEQVGVSPRFYCRLLRFSRAIQLKTEQPGISYTAVAHECGYFDQMHMVKDFKAFSATTPSGYFNQSATFVPEEQFVNMKRSIL